MALCHLKLGEFRATLPLCDQVLAQDPANTKARFRRAQVSKLGILC